MVAQYYDTDVNKEYAIRGNSAILKCVVPSFVADFVKVLSWHTDQGEEFVPGDDYGRRSLALSIFFPTLASRSFLSLERVRKKGGYRFLKKRVIDACENLVLLTPARYFYQRGEAWWPK